MSRNFPVTILKGVLILIGVIILAFTFGTFGVDYDIVTTSYLSVNSNYAATVANSKTKTDAYKVIVEQTVEEFEAAYEAGNIDENGNALYLLPFKCEGYDLSTIRITCDLNTYSEGDASYGTDKTSHNGVDMVPVGPPAIDSSNWDSVKIVAPCDGLLEMESYTYNAVKITAAPYIFRFFHLSSVEKSKLNTRVKKGEVIGNIGGYGENGPSTYGPHLHFAVYNVGTSYEYCYNPFSLGLWDWQHTDVYEYNVYANRDKVKVGRRAATGKPLTFSHLQNFRNINFFKYVYGKDYLDTVAFECNVNNETGEIENLKLYEENSKYLPDCGSFEKEWFPEGVHR